MKKSSWDMANILGIAKKVGIAVLALIVLFVLFLGLTRAIPLVTSSLASAGATLTSVFLPAENITIKADRDIIISGNDVTFTWKHSSPSKTGRYFLKYDCRTNLTLERIGIGSSKIACDTMTPVSKTDTSLLLVPTLKAKDAFTDLILSITFMPDDGSTPLVGKVSVTVQNGLGAIANSGATSSPSLSNNGVTNGGSNNSNIKPATPTYTAPSYVAPTYTTPTYVAPVSYYGLPDLAVTIGQVGVVNGIDNGTLLTKSSYTSFDRVAVKINVTNNGTNNSGQWILRANLPTGGSEVFTSFAQNSLAPGQTAILTLAFNGVRGSQNMNVVVDPFNSIQETNKNNNQANVFLQGDNYGYNNYNYNGYNNYSNYNSNCYTYNNCYNNNNYNYNNTSSGSYYGSTRGGTVISGNNSSYNSGAIAFISSSFVRSTSGYDSSSNNGGYSPDLVTDIIDIGTIDSSGQYSASSNVGINGTAAVRFEIANRGSRNSGTYNFRIDLPTPDNAYFLSDIQNSLAPGEVVNIVVGFTNYSYGYGTIRVIADSNNSISEKNDGNNTDTIGFNTR